PAQIFDNNVTIRNTKDNETENITNTTGKIIVAEIEGINLPIKVCLPPLTITDKNVSCLIAYIYIGTKEYNNLTIADTIPDNFTYLDAKELNASELLNTLNITLPSLPLGLGIENLTAERIDMTVSTTDNKTYIFGSWRTRTLQLAAGLEVYTAIIAINVTLRAPSDINGTSMNLTEAVSNVLPSQNISIPLLNVTIPLNLSSLVSIPADLPALPAQIF
ncbi:hypothetical protein, partial [Tepidimonas sp.]|uniref:hypothetical protein n=1 Tax=Tepidimonas sp. TaxID=2002775 RepID=UPI00391CE257